MLSLNRRALFQRLQRSQWFISASSDGTLKVWDLESGAELRTLKGGGVLAVAVMPDGRRAISGAADGTLKVWDLESGAELRTLTGHTDRVSTVAVTPDGRRAISASSDGTLKVWNLESGAELRTLKGGGVLAVAVMPDGRRVISASWDGTLKVWDLERAQVIASFKGEGEQLVCAVAPNGATIVAGDRSGQVYFLRLENVTPGPPVVTVWQSPADTGYMFGCPHCRMWSEVSDSALGTEVPCPHCRKAVKLNPFVVNADWRTVASAWRRNGQETGQ
jgi:WD40 repeat protein